MLVRKLCLLSIPFGMTLCGTVMAEAVDGEIYVSPLISWIDDNSDKAYDSDLGIHLGIGSAISERWNVEGYYSKYDPEGPAGQTQKGYGVDFQRVFARERRFSPYIFAGLGLLDSDVDGGLDDDGSETASFGIGFLADFARDGRAALRAEFRHRRDRAFGTDGDDNILSLGLQLPFGRTGRRFRDADGDGVEDAMDRCPNTPAGTPVDATGCPEPVDTDGDGVPDSIDMCPGTPAGVVVDSAGCAPDSDRDGVADYQDRCPETVAGATVGSDGCELDGDGDGVVDRLDRCPDTRPGAQVDINGCEIGDEIELPGVQFLTDSDELLPEATSELEGAAQTLINNPEISVEVAGHTDSDGAESYNQDLSARRANTVREFLIDRGVAPDRLVARGYGESSPVADNSTAAGKRQNRRVVLVITAR